MYLNESDSPHTLYSLLHLNSVLTLTTVEHHILSLTEACWFSVSVSQYWLSLHSAGPHSKSFMCVMEMWQQGEKAPQITTQVRRSKEGADLLHNRTHTFSITLAWEHQGCVTHANMHMHKCVDVHKTHTTNKQREGKHKPRTKAQKLMDDITMGLDLVSCHKHVMMQTNSKSF